LKTRKYASRDPREDLNRALLKLLNRFALF